MSSCLFSTPEQPSRQHRHTPRMPMTPMTPDVVLAALGASGASDMDVNWLSSPDQYNDNDDDSIIISPFQDVFPKREMFDSFDLSRIPLSLFPASMPASLDSSAPVGTGVELGSAFTPEAISPTTLTPASSTSASSSSMSSSAGMSNPLVFDAAAFGQTNDIYSMQASSSPLSDTQDSQTSSQAAPMLSAASTEQSIRAPMNILPSKDRLASKNSPVDTKQKDSAMTTPPSRKLSLPQPLFQTPKHTPRKRKSMGSAASSTSSRSSSSPPPQSSGSGSGSSTSPSTTPLHPRKSTHNMIEKRYRTNINEKIAALRDAVPSLRLMVQRMEREGQAGLIAGSGLLGTGESILMDDADMSTLEAEQHFLGGLAPAHKLNKATVLSKATEYIAHLERNNAALSREVGQLRHRLTDTEMVLMQQQHQHHAHPHQQMQQQRNALAYGAGVW